jgi:LmbE family N-acetylglucosaminyl deacetylase
MFLIRSLSTGWWRQFFKRSYQGMSGIYFKFFEHQVNTNSCIVFAPHQDDETLGCGGTIIKKLKKGARAKVVYMTNGNNSHKHTHAINLKDRRREEAISACKVLGFKEEDIIFMDYEDGSLQSNFNEAVKEVVEVLESFSPQEIYIPYIEDHHPDHKSTNRIAIEAVKQVGRKTIVMEYPTWFWDHWPIVTIESKRKKHFINHLKNSFTSIGHLLRDLRYSVDIRDVIDIKREALYKHVSQLTRLDEDDNWFILGDVSNGDWLDCFFRSREVFYRHTCG